MSRQGQLPQRPSTASKPSSEIPGMRPGYEATRLPPRPNTGDSKAQTQNQQQVDNDKPKIQVPLHSPPHQAAQPYQAAQSYQAMQQNREYRDQRDAVVVSREAPEVVGALQQNVKKLLGDLSKLHQSVTASRKLNEKSKELYTTLIQNVGKSLQEFGRENKVFGFIRNNQTVNLLNRLDREMREYQEALRAYEASGYFDGEKKTHMHLEAMDLNKYHQILDMLNSLKVPPQEQIKQTVIIKVPNDEYHDVIEKHVAERMPGFPRFKPVTLQQTAPNLTIDPTLIRVPVPEFMYVEKSSDPLFDGHKYFLGIGVTKNIRKAMEYYDMSHKNGDVKGTNCLGEIHLNGHGGIRKDPVKAFEYFKIAADKDSPDALYKIGSMIESGLIQDNPQKVVQNFKKAAQRDHVAALTDLGFIHENGKHGLKQDVREACRCYRRAADQFYPRAMNNLAVLLLSHPKMFHEYPDQPHAAYDYLREAAKYNYPLAITNLGICYERGLGCSRDPDQAIKNYEEAARKGDFDGKYYYGLQLIRIGVLQDDGMNLLKGTQVLREVLYLNSKHPQANFLMGFLYENGVGVEENLEWAMHYYQLAADQGSSKAIVSIGNLYFNGLGTGNPNYKLALEKYYEAAEKKNPEALTNLGAMYEDGLGVEQDYERAIDYYEMARGRNGDASFHLAELYAHGVYVHQDDEKAWGLYREAADHGNQIARKIMRDTLRTREDDEDDGTVYDGLTKDRPFMSVLAYAHGPQSIFPRSAPNQ